MQLAKRNVRLSFLCSQGDPLLDELREAGGKELQSLCTRGQITLDIIPRSDHTFSSLEDHGRLLNVILQRIGAMALPEKIPVNASEFASQPDMVTAGDSVASL